MDKIISIFKALSDKNRLRVVVALMNRDELCACEISGFMGVTSATASRHLGVLLSANLINSRKSGRWVYYSLNNENSMLKPLLKWIEGETNNESFGETNCCSIVKGIGGIIEKISPLKPINENSIEEK